MKNRPGASGAIGSKAVTRAAPDVRMLLVQVNTFVMGPPIFARATYDLVAQFTPIIHLHQRRHGAGGEPRCAGRLAT